jgi:hypothetical protein
MDEPMATAASILRERYSGALVVILTESVLDEGRTARSDLDLVVVLAEATVPRWEGFRAGGWVAEAFVADVGGWLECIAREVRARCPVVLRISATGVALTANQDTAELQRRARDNLAEGPPPLTVSESELACRLVTDFCKDLEGGLSEQERAFVVEALARQAAELLLVSRGQWRGEGKWLARTLDDAEPGLAQSFTSAITAAHAGDPTQLTGLARAAVDASGGAIGDVWAATLE